MRSSLLILLLLLLLNGYGQDSSHIRNLLSEGMALHDQGRFDDAVKKYDEVLIIAPGFLPAQYEKSYALMAGRKFKEAITVSREIIKNNKADANMVGNAYSTWGMALDEAGSPKKALRVYREGCKKAPGCGVINFNKALCYLRLKETGKGIQELQLSLLKNPRYAPSHYLMGRVMSHSHNYIAAVMSYMLYLVFDNRSPRAAAALVTIRDFFNADTAILLQTRELLPGDRFALQVAKMIETRVPRVGTGFWERYYGPFFRALKEGQYCESFAHRLFLPSENVMNEAWLQDHQRQVEAFLIWFESYHWPGVNELSNP